MGEKPDGVEEVLRTQLHNMGGTLVEMEWGKGDGHNPTDWGVAKIRWGQLEKKLVCVVEVNVKLAKDPDTRQAYWRLPCMPVADAVAVFYDAGLAAKVGATGVCSGNTRKDDYRRLAYVQDVDPVESRPGFWEEIPKQSRLSEYNLEQLFLGQRLLLVE